MAQRSDRAQAAGRVMDNRRAVPDPVDPVDLRVVNAAELPPLPPGAEQCTNRFACVGELVRCLRTAGHAGACWVDLESRP